MDQKIVAVLGAGGFIGGHLVTKLKNLGCKVIGADIKTHEFKKTDADEFYKVDLRDVSSVEKVLDGVTEVYQLAADMGGAEFVFSGENDSDIMHNSALININVLNTCVKYNIKKIFYASSACVYPEHNQMDPDNPNCEESSAYPANPDSEYGWEKLFSERLYLAYNRNKGITVKIGRFHNIFGPFGTWEGGREKAPAAMCRKVAMCINNGTIDVFGDGKQTRSFLFIDECIEGIIKLMNSKDFDGPVNIGSEEMVTINRLVEIVTEIAEKKINLNHIPGPLGVRGRNSCNTLIKEKLDWKPSLTLKSGLEKTFHWIFEQIKKR